MHDENIPNKNPIIKPLGTTNKNPKTPIKNPSTTFIIIFFLSSEFQFST